MGALGVATFVAVVAGAHVPLLHDLPARWAWLASITLLAAGYLTPAPAAAGSAQEIARVRRLAAATDRGDVPPVVWTLLAFTVFWIGVSAIDHARAGDTRNVAFTLPLTDFVNDRAHVLDVATQQRLAAMLQKFAESTPSQVVVAIYPRAPDGAIEEFTIRTVERLPVGRADLGNGVLLFVFMAERAARLEVGYGLEGTLTDVAAHEILERTLAPAFARGAYAEGLKATLQAVMATAQAADRDNRLSGTIGLAARKLISGPPFFERLGHAIRDATLLRRIGVTLLCTFIGFALASTAGQWAGLARDMRRGAGNLMTGRKAAEGMEKVDVGEVLDSVWALIRTLAILRPRGSC